MADLPILDAVNPEVIPAKTYDRVWVEESNNPRTRR